MSLDFGKSTSLTTGTCNCVLGYILKHKTIAINILSSVYTAFYDYTVFARGLQIVA